MVVGREEEGLREVEGRGMEVAEGHTVWRTGVSKNDIWNLAYSSTEVVVIFKYLGSHLQVILRIFQFFQYCVYVITSHSTYV